MQTLLKFKIGLAVIGVFVLGLAVYVSAQASSTKQDTQTYNAANGIAQRLDGYINAQGVIPSSLQAAGISTVPSSVTYTKLSDQSYKFCVTYKAKDDGIASTSLTDVLVNLEGPVVSSSDSPDSTALYISPAHHKGENCQTISPPAVGFASPDNNTFNNSYTYDPGTPLTQTQ